jgi:hypothetical protein
VRNNWVCLEPKPQIKRPITLDTNIVLLLLFFQLLSNMIIYLLFWCSFSLFFSISFQLEHCSFFGGFGVFSSFLGFFLIKKKESLVALEMTPNKI